jgi:hypothetical protein
MNTASLDFQRAELARKILNETDERIVMALWRHFDASRPPVTQKASKKVTFNSISLDTRDYKFDRQEANAR